MLGPRNCDEPREQTLTCPYCWQEITMLIEPTEEQQQYVEDCEVCCNPIEVTFGRDAGGELNFNAAALGQ